MLSLFLFVALIVSWVVDYRKSHNTQLVHLAEKSVLHREASRLQHVIIRLEAENKRLYERLGESPSIERVTHDD